MEFIQYSNKFRRMMISEKDNFIIVAGFAKVEMKFPLNGIQVWLFLIV